jgi:hypothetical protein
MWIRLGFAGAIVSLGLWGCGPKSDCGRDVHVVDCNKTKLGFGQMRKDILKTSCVFSECHNAASHMNNLDLETDPYTALVNVDPDNAKAKAMGWKRVVPNNKAQSFMWQKLQMTKDEDPKTGLGKAMPDTGQCLDTVSMDNIGCWIDRGAPND